MENPSNRIVAVGRLEGGLELSHEVMNEPFYTGTLLVKRLSGAVDRLPVTIPGKLMGLPFDSLFFGMAVSVVCFAAGLAAKKKA